MSENDAKMEAVKLLKQIHVAMDFPKLEQFLDSKYGTGGWEARLPQAEPLEYGAKSISYSIDIDGRFAIHLTTIYDQHDNPTSKMCTIEKKFARKFGMSVAKTDRRVILDYSGIRKKRTDKYKFEHFP